MLPPNARRGWKGCQTACKMCMVFNCNAGLSSHKNRPQFKLNTKECM